jgi:hypothetical protein
MIPRIFAFIVICIFALCALAASEHAQPNANLPLVKADYQRCITIRNGPVQKTRTPLPNQSQRGIA